MALVSMQAIKAPVFYLLYHLFLIDFLPQVFYAYLACSSIQKKELKDIGLSIKVEKLV